MLREDEPEVDGLESEELNAAELVAQMSEDEEIEQNAAIYW